MSKTTLRFLVCAVLAGCSAPPANVDDDSFKLTMHTGSELDATLTSGGDSLRLMIVEVQARVVDVTFDFGNPVINFRLDYDKGEGDLTPAGKPLSENHLRLINELSTRLDTAIDVPEENQPLVDFVMIRMISYMQIAPVGEIIERSHFVSARGWTNISPTCGTQNIGGGYSARVGKGCGCTSCISACSNGCAGRCGQGCGGTSTPKCSGSTAYTQDCARHDLGVGSWASASDDYSFANNNASCSGTNCY